MDTSKTYPPETEEVRQAVASTKLGYAAIADKIGVKRWALYHVCTGLHVRVDTVNKVRRYFRLKPVGAKPRKNAKQGRELARRKAEELRLAPAPTNPPAENETLPSCDWNLVAKAAAELSAAATDFQFIAERYQEATFRLRAANRAALAAGIAVAPTLVSGAGKSLKASKHTTQFFKLLSVGGALS